MENLEDAAVIDQVDFQICAIRLLNLVDRRARPSHPLCHLSALALSAFRFVHNVGHSHFHPPSDHCKSVSVIAVSLQDSHLLHPCEGMRRQARKEQQRRDSQEAMFVMEHNPAYMIWYG